MMHFNISVTISNIGKVCYEAITSTNLKKKKDEYIFKYQKFKQAKVELITK